jgi:hypothetical protein
MTELYRACCLAIPDIRRSGPQELEVRGGGIEVGP